MSFETTIVERVRALAREISEREGCLLYDVEFTGGGRGRVLRVYIDRPTGSVSLDDCTNVSRGLNLLLDVEDLIPGGSYDLEVSSPGLERKLVERWHFEKAIGQPVRVKTKVPVAGNQPDMRPQTLIEGELNAVDQDQLVIRKDGQDWRVALDQVAKANVKFIVPETGVKGKKKR